jgi:hypothetical protein
MLAKSLSALKIRPIMEITLKYLILLKKGKKKFRPPQGLWFWKSNV